jgi:hypothetical protein
MSIPFDKRVTVHRPSLIFSISNYRIKVKERKEEKTLDSFTRFARA